MKKQLKIIFFGTDDFSVAVLNELYETNIQPTFIITAPDAPKGRGLLRTAPPVKVWAKEKDIDIVQPESLKDSHFIEKLKNTEWDLFLVASYGHIIPKDILDIPKHGALNVHPSLLPKFRGASPIQSAILADEQETGVSIMLMDEKMDHGPIVAQASITPEPWPPKANVLKALLAHEGGKLLTEVIPEWVRGAITPEPQDESKATYSKKIAKEDGEIDLAGDSYQNFLKIRALAENPGAYFFTTRNGKSIRVKITEAEYTNGSLVIVRVIPEGKKEIRWTDYAKRFQ